MRIVGRGDFMEGEEKSRRKMPGWLAYFFVVMGIIAACFVGGFLRFTVFGAESSKDDAEKIEQLEDENAELRSEVDYLTEEVEELQYQIDNPDEFK